MTDVPPSASATAGESRVWNHHPNLPIPTSPVFAWPPRPGEALRWLAGYWLAISMTALEFFLAWAVWTWLQPAPGTMATFGLGWIGQIWLRNLVLMTLVAGGLHIWLYTFSAQGKALNFDARALARDNGTYSFRDQVLDNMFWTLASGVTVWTLFEVLYFWATANGWAPGLTFARNPVWFVLWFPLIPIWSSLHFYWIHRALHWPPLYRIAHALHHRNINIGPWTGISTHPVEHLLYFSSVAIHFVVASHPAHFLFHIYIQALNPAASHSGFDGLLVRDRKRVELGDFFHQLHHRNFECNYGTAEMPWDRWFGSLHNGTQAATQRTRERKRRMHGS
ncbi:MAG: sterol desaturase family protein [Paracoccaceae bacterium]|nr:sterol desaturase family protein [Paracoccaceae bacterium]